MGGLFVIMSTTGQKYLRLHPRQFWAGVSVFLLRMLSLSPSSSLSFPSAPASFDLSLGDILQSFLVLSLYGSLAQ